MCCVDLHPLHSKVAVTMPSTSRSWYPRSLTCFSAGWSNEGRLGNEINSTPLLTLKSIGYLSTATQTLVD